MKKILLIFLALLSSVCSYAQLTMRIDSVDISKGIEIDDGNVVNILEDDYPFLRIATTIINDTEVDIWIYEPEYYGRPDMWLEFYIGTKRYHESLQWINTNKPAEDGVRYKDYFGIYLRPHERKRVVSWTPLPAEADSPQDSHPVGWTWGKDPSDADFLRWFNEVLPTLKVICFYGQETKNIKKLVSEPINLKTIKITTNFKDERIN